jgi:CheY-like chemotaxis protein
MLGMVLAKKGLECETSPDGLAALERVAEQTFDLVFMDSRMPKMNGLVCTGKLRELGFTGLVIGFTGNAMQEDVDEFLTAGADLVFPKPLKMTHLDSLLKYCSAHGTRSPMLPANATLAQRHKLGETIGIDIK